MEQKEAMGILMKTKIPLKRNFNERDLFSDDEDVDMNGENESGL